MFALMHYSLSLLAVMSRASIVHDQSNQRVESERFCKQMGSCAPGEHVICRYGKNVTKMGPRCGGGKPFDISRQKTHLLDLINQTRRKLAKRQIKGLPQAYGMMQLYWNDTLAEFAQVWANQCNGRDRVCASTFYFPNSYQIKGIIHFSYPEFRYNQTVVPEATRDKFFIDKFVQLLYETNKDKINASIIEKTTEETYNNAFLVMVNGFTTEVGCGASVFVDYYKQDNSMPEIKYVLLMVCTFSNMPLLNGKVYETSHSGLLSTSPCGCSKKRVEVDCLCALRNSDSQKGKGDNGKGNTVKGDTGKGDTGKGDTGKGDSSSSLPGKCSPGDRNCRSPVVVMPIFAFEDADSERLKQIQQAPKPPAISSLEARQEAIRQRIRDRVQTVRNRYFDKAHDVMIEPGTRFFGGGPVEGTFPHEETTIHSYPTKNRPNIDIKPRKDFSNLEELVSEYLSYKHAQAMTSPPKYRPFNDIGQTTRKSYRRNGDDRNENYKYATNVNNRQSANIRKLRYGVPGFDYNNSPYIDNENDQTDQISRDLYNLEQKSEDFAFDDIMNENSRMRRTDLPRKYDNYVRPTIENVNPMDYSEPNDDVYEENPNIAYYTRTVQKRVNRPVTRYENPLHTHRSTSHSDYYNAPTKSQSILMNIANDNTPHAHVYGHSGFKTRSHENKNEFRKYLDTMKRIRPFKPLHSEFGDSSEYHRHHRVNYDEEHAEQHYYVPDRANIRH